MTHRQRQQVPPVTLNVNYVLLVDVLLAEYLLNIEYPERLFEDITSFFQR